MIGTTWLSPLVNHSRAARGSGDAATERNPPTMPDVASVAPARTPGIARMAAARLTHPVRSFDEEIRPFWRASFIRLVVAFSVRSDESLIGFPPPSAGGRPRQASQRRAGERGRRRRRRAA